MILLSKWRSEIPYFVPWDISSLFVCAVSFIHGFCVSISWLILGLYMNRVRKRKNQFEIPAFFMFDQGTSGARKFKTKKYLGRLYAFFIFSALQLPHSKVEKAGNFKISFTFPYSIVYNPS